MSVRHPSNRRADKKVTLVFNNLKPDELADQLTFLEFKAFRRITVMITSLSFFYLPLVGTVFIHRKGLGVAQVATYPSLAFFALSLVISSISLSLTWAYIVDKKRNRLGMSHKSVFLYLYVSPCVHCFKSHASIFHIWYLRTNCLETGNCCKHSLI